MPYARRGGRDESNYRHVTRELAVVIAGRYAGSLRVYERGHASFEYDGAYSGPSISVRMPVSGERFLDDVVRPWVEGLLPDNEAVRESMGKAAGLSGRDPYALLARYGRDCPGAVQICPPEEVAGVLSLVGSYEPVSDDEIGARLLEAQSSSAPRWVGDEESWSLGGAQGKLALARIGTGWGVCIGSAATTHILKPGVEGISLQALDEYLCMRVAARCGLPVASVSYEEFAGVPAIVVERYDRRVDAAGGVERLHQEDLCQALGYLPADKYRPTPSEVLRLLGEDRTGQSVDDFVAALFFNYLVGATDAHAKNYSIMHLAGDEFFLAPMYDVASVLPYRRLRRSPRGCAMPIGREKHFGRLAGSHIERFANNNRLDGEACRELMRGLALDVREAVREEVGESTRIDGVRILGPELERTVVANCDAMLANLARDGRSIDLSRCAVIESGSIDRAGGA